MNSESKSYIYTAPDGSQVSGKYTLTDEGVFTFDKGFGNTQAFCNGQLQHACQCGQHPAHPESQQG